ncbi:MAG TPA: thiamine-phosphate kinase, partial [Tardiphaga sp.]
MASGEDSLISTYFKPLATDPGAFGLNDDAAVLQARGEDVVVNTDAIVEGVHFLADDPADTIARKALRVNLSDLAAKGAVPAGFVLTLALRGQDHDWLAAFARGLGEDARLFGCPLLGGDTVSTPGPIMISITAFGRVPEGRMVRRSGAVAGDLVMVTGTIGDAALGLDVLKGGAARAALAHD